MDLEGNAANEELSGTSGKFALFAEDPNSPMTASDLSDFWIGIEDRGGFEEGLGDYDDMIVSVSSVAEPGFIGVLPLALCGLCCLVIHKRHYRIQSNL